jgi:hypothetical protein
MCRVRIVRLRLQRDGQLTLRLTDSCYDRDARSKYSLQPEGREKRSVRKQWCWEGDVVPFTRNSCNTVDRAQIEDDNIYVRPWNIMHISHSRSPCSS